MPRRDLMRRYDELAERVPSLDEAAQHVVLPTRVHAEVIDLLDELLGMVPANSGPVGHALKLLHRTRPVLLREFASVPPEKIVEGLHAIGSRMLAVGAEGEVVERGDDAAAGAVDATSRPVAQAT